MVFQLVSAVFVHMRDTLNMLIALSRFISWRQ